MTQVVDASITNLSVVEDVTKPLRVAVIYFGYVSRIDLTIESIHNNVFAENRDISFYSLASLATVEKFTNPRDGESRAASDTFDIPRLKADDYLTVREDPDSIADSFAAARHHGDFYDNNWTSVRHVLHSLASLDRAWTFLSTMKARRFDYYLFLRPDLQYLDKIRIKEIIGNFRGSGSIAIPPWHSWSGFNDRFALADPVAAQTYARRVRLVADYCQQNRLHPEMLLRHALNLSRSKVCVLPVRANRVSSNGTIHTEDFALAVEHLPQQSTEFEVTEKAIVFVEPPPFGTLLLPHWRKDKHTFCERLRSNIAPLKIVLKTKNEGVLLEDWIAYYAAMVGYENLIIFDHESNSSETLEIYKGLNGMVPIVQYSGFHNNVHNVNVMPELYESLQLSCSFFGFFDTDERLALFAEGHFVSSAAIVDFLMSRKEVQAFPGTWLNNTMCSRNIFSMSAEDLEWGLKWGKPIIASTAAIDGIIMHNSQLPVELYGNGSTLELFCFHLKNLYPSQRIAANIAKLASRGLISSEALVEDVLSSSLQESADPIVRMYIDEIRRMSTHTGVAAPVAAGQIEVAENGSVGAVSDTELNRLSRYVQDEAPVTIARVLNERVVY